MIQVQVRMSPETLDRVEKQIPHVRQRNMNDRMTRSDVVRVALEIGLRKLEGENAEAA